MPPPINYVAYVDARLGVARVGHLDFESDSITPLTFKSGTSVASLYQVIEAGDEHIAAPGGGGGTSEDDGPAAFPASSVKLLPPLAGRDVLAVGKNYSEHAAEFNRSGYDSSDKVDQPTHPVIFTKRATSIIAHGDEIYAHPEFTQSLDYEGELGLIIGWSRSGKSAFRVSEEEAWDHVWGFTIINDVTARERQRDHKQFFVGKSADTTCPMVFDPQSQECKVRSDEEIKGTCSCCQRPPSRSPACPDFCEWRAKAKCNNRRSHLLDSILDQDNF